MRRRVRAGGGQVGWETTPQTLLDELYASGAISTGVLRDLERLSRVRGALGRGFADPGAVRFLVETARRLLAEAQPVKQTA
jgi:hypothetical protein